MPGKDFGVTDRPGEWSRQVRDLMDEMQSRNFVEFRATGAWQPRVNLYASRVAFRICVELAGLQPEDLRVECPDQTHVRITGRRQRPCLQGMESPCSVEEMEIDEGAFVRELDLPDAVDSGAVEVSYDRGFLWIRLPRSATT